MLIQKFYNMKINQTHIYIFLIVFVLGLGTCKSSLLNKSFSMESSADFNGGFSADVYVTYAYTKVL